MEDLLEWLLAQALAPENGTETQSHSLLTKAIWYKISMALCILEFSLSSCS